MSVNKVVYGHETLIDLTSDTVSPGSLLEGMTAHDAAGSPVTGTVAFITVYTGEEKPDDAAGNDGDIFLII